MTTLRLVISGRVQMVGYRDWLVMTATARGVEGWVRNRADGSVEALLHGEDAAVRQVLAACHTGPRAARVADIATEPADPPATPGFHRLPTV
jgi:acylphosphatase